MDVAELYRRKLTTPEEALGRLPRRADVLLGWCSAQPPALISALVDRVRAGQHDEVKVRYMHSTAATGESMLRLELMDVLKPHPFSMGAAERALVRKSDRKVVFFVPCSFSQIPDLIRTQLRCDVFLLQVAPMDRAGWLSFGLSGAYSLAGIESSKHVVVEVNPLMPRSHGTCMVHISEVDAVVEQQSPLPVSAVREPSAADLRIASLVLPMVRDGACLQFGVGTVPNIIAAQLSDHKDLGVHTELLSDGIASLISSGAVTNRRKDIDVGKSVYNVALGTAVTNDIIDDNPGVECRAADYINDPRVIGRNDNVVSVNAMIEVDLTGQVNAEFLSARQFSGAGGQLDFVRGAYLSKGGLSLIVATSTAAQGKVSRIVPTLQGPATDTRMDPQYIGTEYGLVELRGRSSTERAEALISLAHPDFRDELTQCARQMRLI